MDYGENAASIFRRRLCLFAGVNSRIALGGRD